MRYSASEKYEIIRLVEAPSLPIRQTLRQLDIGKSAFYSWLKRYQDNGIDGLEDKIDEIQGYLLSKPVDAQAL
jgi:transposase-like protein